MNRFIAKHILYKKNTSYPTALKNPSTVAHAECDVNTAKCFGHFSLPLYPLYGTFLACVTAIGVYGYLAIGISLAY